VALADAIAELAANRRKGMSEAGSDVIRRAQIDLIQSGRLEALRCVKCRRIVYRAVKRDG
jgi:hypothetical protein